VREKAKGADSSFAGYEMLGREPTPAEAAVLREMVERLLASLPDRDRQIVALNLEGKSNREISAHINRAERTVRRTLDQFRAKLETAVFEPSTIF
jgi:RNA polymerase sigma factor (sigma-70 family)